jgi:hypothetical protein
MPCQCQFFPPEHPDNKVTQLLDHCGGLNSTA